MEPAGGMASREQRGDTRLENRGPAPLQVLDLRFDRIDTGDRVTVSQQTRNGNQPNVAGAEDGDIQERPPRSAPVTVPRCERLVGYSWWESSPRGRDAPISCARPGGSGACGLGRAGSSSSMMRT